MNAVEFELLVREYISMVRSLVYHITRDPNDVEDMVQEVFIKAYQSMDAFRGGSFRAYLGRIARNHCYDTLRQKRSRRLGQNESLSEDLAAPDETPEQTVVNRERIAEVYEILNEMNQVDREIMLLRHVHQFSFDEIAAVLGMKSGAVRTRISRARQRVIEEVERRENREPSIMG